MYAHIYIYTRVCVYVYSYGVSVWVGGIIEVDSTSGWVCDLFWNGGPGGMGHVTRECQLKKGQRD